MILKDGALRGSKSLCWGGAGPHPQSEESGKLVWLSLPKPLGLTTSEPLVESRGRYVSQQWCPRSHQAFPVPSGFQDSVDLPSIPLLYSPFLLYHCCCLSLYQRVPPRALPGLALALGISVTPRTLNYI